MKLFILSLTMLFTASTFSGVLTGKDLETQNVDVSHAEFLDSSDPTEFSTVSLNEVRAYLASVDQNSTCLDEMLHRRKQLILKLSFAPVLGPVQVVGSALGLGFVLANLGKLDPTPGSWADLAGAAVGIVYGGLFATISFGTDTTKSIIKLSQLNTMIKTLGEQYITRSGVKTEKFYNYYLKKSHTGALTQDAFVAELLNHDKDGSLCDGSMVKQPWFFKKSRGNKLKFRVASNKDFVRYLDKNQ